jgi:methyl-accepting chemotaxis protein
MELSFNATRHQFLTSICSTYFCLIPKVFQDALKENEALPMSKALKTAIAGMRPTVDGYIGAARVIVAQAFDQPEAMAQQMPEFMHTFSLLEKQMADVSDMMEKDSTVATAQAQRAAMLSTTVSSSLLGAATIVLSLFSLFLIRSIVGSINQVRCAVENLNSGEADLTQRLPQLDGEFARLGAALNIFLDNIAGIIGNVSASAVAIEAAAGQIAARNVELSGRTEAQAGSLEETASTMEELTSTVSNNAANARHANELVLSAASVASRGGEVVSEVVNTMTSIKDSSRRIVDIIAVIDGIAFQTNILALNAAVEAARAGEQGRGFAVVASEVRNLAQRSAGAAREIKSLIANSVVTVDAGSRLVDEAGQTMQNIVAAVQEVALIMAEISAASMEQSTGIGQVHQAISEIDRITQQNAAMVQQESEAANRLQVQAEDLVETVNIFRLAAAAAPAVRAPTLRPAKNAPPVRVHQARKLVNSSNSVSAEWEQF